MDVSEGVPSKYALQKENDERLWNLSDTLTECGSLEL